MRINRIICYNKITLLLRACIYNHVELYLHHLCRSVIVLINRIFHFNWWGLPLSLRCYLSIIAFYVLFKVLSIASHYFSHFFSSIRMPRLKDASFFDAIHKSGPFLISLYDRNAIQVTQGDPKWLSEEALFVE